MKKRLFKIVLVLGVIGGVVYGMFYLWEHRYEYFFQGEIIEKIDDINEGVVEKGMFKEGENGKEGESDDKDMNTAQNNEAGLEDYTAPTIAKSDCRQECKRLKEVENDYKYCREICGLNEIREVAIPEVDEIEEENGCGGIEDVFRADVCWKEKAIKEKNASYCENISDDKMSKVCKNRVLEEIMD